MRKLEAKTPITVCSKCLCASCWQGFFMCDESRTAGTVTRTRSELRPLGRENPEWWKDSLEHPGHSVAAVAITRGMA